MASDNSQVATTYKDKGNVEFRAGNYEKACALYRQAIELDMKYAVAYSNRSASFLALGKYTEAHADALKCIEVDPSFEKGYYRCYAALDALGKTDEAKSFIVRGLEKNPGSELLLQQATQLDIGVPKPEAEEESSNTTGRPSLSVVVTDESGDNNADGGDGGGGAATPPVTPTPRAVLIHSAVTTNDLMAVANIIVEVGADVNSKDRYSRTPLMVAAQAGDHQMVGYLLGRGADPAPKSRYGASTLSWAAREEPTTPTSARAGADADGLKGVSALTWAADSDQLHTARMLLSFPEVHAPFAADNSYAQDATGDTILHVACRAGNWALVKIILGYGLLTPAVVNSNFEKPSDVTSDPLVLETIRDSESMAPCTSETDNTRLKGGIPSAIRGRDLYALRQLVIDKECAAGSNEKSGLPYIVEAAKSSWTDGVALLLLRGADVMATDANGKTALMYACGAGNESTASILIAHTIYADRDSEADAPPKLAVQDSDGNTALHYAVLNGNKSVVRFLLVGARHQGEALTLVFNNAGQLAADAATETVAAVFAKYFSDLDEGIPSIVKPFPAAFHEPTPCPICFITPAEEDTVKFRCDCSAFYCDDCLRHLVTSAHNAGEFPVCAGADCSRKISMEPLHKLVPQSTQMGLVAILVNEETPVPTQYKVECSVCLRANDTTSSLEANSLRFQCTHCQVCLCVVCNGVYPLHTHDDGIHAGCKDKLGNYRLFLELQNTVKDAAQRKCPCCLEMSGVKDDACTHMECESCYRSYCYICGMHFEDIDRHGVDSSWTDMPEVCPMYHEYLKSVDDRVKDVGDGPDCECIPCYAKREVAGSSILNTLRVRYSLLKFIESHGKEKFLEVTDRFNYFDTLNMFFFEGKFPRDGDELVDCFELEPEDVQNFYREREHWFSYDCEEDPERAEPHDEGRLADDYY